MNKELEQEEALSKISKEEEVRAKVVEKYGLDEVDHAGLIDQLTKDRLEDQKHFGELVGQKRKYREENELVKAELEKAKQTKTPVDDVRKYAEEAAMAVLEKRDLENLGLPDALQAEAQMLAKATGKSVKTVLSEYLKPQMDAFEKQKRTDEAAISQTNQSAAQKSETQISMKGIDFSTEEGRKEWDKRLGRK